MLKERYNPETKECKDCGCLIPDRPIDIEEHICSPYAIERKLKEWFGPRKPKEKQLFKVGHLVEANLMGIIDSVIITRKGDIMYRISDEAKNIHGYFLQSQIGKLIEPEDLIPDNADIHEPMEERKDENELP